MKLNMKSKRRNIAKWLHENEGGKWRYDGCASWWCDDGKRNLSRVSDGEDFPVHYYIYGAGTPKRIYQL